MVESDRWRRLRWRLRGAWQWPTFALLTVLDALLVAWLPFQGEGGDAIGAVLIVGFFNLLAVAVVAPFLGMALRRRRPDLPLVIARDYAGTALLVTIFLALLVGGLLHRGPRVDQQNARAAGETAVRDWLAREEPAFAPITARGHARARARPLPRLRLHRRRAAPDLPVRQHGPVPAGTDP